MEDQVRTALLTGIAAAVSEELAKGILEALIAAMRERLEAKRGARQAKHFATRH